MFKALYSNTFLIGTSATILIAFYMTLVDGQVIIKEDSRSILILEILMMLAILGYALANWIILIRRLYHERKKKK